MNADLPSTPASPAPAAPRPAWILPALCSTVSLVLCGSAVAVVLGSMILALLFESATVFAAGLLSGAVLGAAGGLSLFSVLSSLKREPLRAKVDHR